MPEKEKFKIIRFVGVRGCFYGGMDCAEGMRLGEYLKTYPDCRKEDLFRWMEEAGRELIKLRKSAGKRVYGTITPQTFLVTDRQEICLLASGTLTEGKEREQKEKEEIRGLLLTWYFMLAESRPYPALTWTETGRLKKLFRICRRLTKEEPPLSYECRRSGAYRENRRQEEILERVLKHIPDKKKKEKKGREGK